MIVKSLGMIKNQEEDKAKLMTLDYMSFGVMNKDKKVTHKSINFN